MLPVDELPDLGLLLARIRADLETQVVCVDRKRQRSRVGNIKHSAALRNGMAALKPRRS